MFFKVRSFSLAYLLKIHAKQNTTTGKQLQKIGSLKITPLKTLHYTPSLWSPLFPLKTILESLYKRSCLLAVNCYTVSNWGIQMSAVVKTNVQWWVLIPLPSKVFHKGSRVRAHIATALTADWMEGVLSRPCSLGPLRLPVYLAALFCSLLLLLPTQLCLGNLKGKNSRAIMTEYSSMSP